MVRLSYKTHHFHPLVTVHSNDITDGGSVKSITARQRTAFDTNTPKVSQFIVIMAKTGFCFCHLDACILLQFKHSSDK